MAAQDVWDTRRRRILIVLLIGLAAMFVFSLLIGRYPTLRVLAGGQLFSDELSQRLILNLRLPRALAAVLLGMSLAAAGMVFQTIFANPLVEPGFLGVSQGAAFGTALCIVCFGSATMAIPSPEQALKLAEARFAELQSPTRNHSPEGSRLRNQKT
jgi:iron complex transport system permease protein